jgi:hypothetical protein
MLDLPHVLALIEYSAIALHARFNHGKMRYGNSTASDQRCYSLSQTGCEDSVNNTHSQCPK